MRSLVLFTLSKDESKIRSNITKCARPGIGYFTHQVKLIGAGGKKRDLHEEVRAWVISMSKGYTIETIVWVGHAGVGKLSGEGAEGGGSETAINLDQVAELIVIAKPRVVNLFACKFGGETGTVNVPPYAVPDGPLYLARKIATTSSWTGHVMVLNSDKSTAMFVTTTDNFQEAFMDRNIMIADRAVAEVKYFEVSKIMTYARAHTEGEYVSS